MPESAVRYVRLSCEAKDCIKWVDYPSDSPRPDPWVVLDPPKVWAELIAAGIRTEKATLYFCGLTHLTAWLERNLLGKTTNPTAPNAPKLGVELVVREMILSPDPPEMKP